MKKISLQIVKIFCEKKVFFKNMESAMPVYWFTASETKQRDEQARLTKRPKREKVEKYEMYETTNNPVKFGADHLFGILYFDDLHLQDDPRYLKIVGWNEEKTLPILEFRGEKSICVSFDNAGVYQVTQESNPKTTFQKIQILKKRDPVNIENEGEKDICITIVPHRGEAVDESQFFTWNFTLEDVGEYIGEWPKSLKFIKKCIGQNNFVVAPYSMTAAKLALDLTDFVGPALHPLDAKIGYEIFVHCEAFEE